MYFRACIKESSSSLVGWMAVNVESGFGCPRLLLPGKMQGTLVAASAFLGARGAGSSAPGGDALDHAGAGGGGVSARTGRPGLEGGRSGSTCHFMAPSAFLSLILIVSAELSE